VIVRPRPVPAKRRVVGEQSPVGDREWIGRQDQGEKSEDVLQTESGPPAEGRLVEWSLRCGFSLVQQPVALPDVLAHFDFAEHRFENPLVLDRGRAIFPSPQVEQGPRALVPDFETSILQTKKQSVHHSGCIAILEQWGDASADREVFFGIEQVIQELTRGTGRDSTERLRDHFLDFVARKERDHERHPAGRQ